MFYVLENCSFIPRIAINLIFVVLFAYLTVNFGTIECLVAFGLIQLLMVLSMPPITIHSSSKNSSKSHKHMLNNNNKDNNTLIYNTFNWLNNWTYILNGFYTPTQIKSNKSIDSDISVDLLSTELTKSRKHLSLLQLKQHHQEEETAKKSNDLRRMIANVAHDLKTVSLTFSFPHCNTIHITLIYYIHSYIFIHIKHLAYEWCLLWPRPSRESHTRSTLCFTYNDTRAVTSLTSNISTSIYRDYTSSQECE